MIARWVDLWVNWLDQFRYLIAPERLRKPYKQDTGEVDPVHGLDAPHPGWRPDYKKRGSI